MTHVKVKPVDKIQLEDYMFKVLSSVLQKSAHKCPNLTLAKAMMKFLNSTRSIGTSEAGTSLTRSTQTIFRRVFPHFFKF